VPDRGGKSKLTGGGRFLPEKTQRGKKKKKQDQSTEKEFPGCAKEENARENLRDGGKRTEGKNKEEIS